MSTKKKKHACRACCVAAKHTHTQNTMHSESIDGVKQNIVVELSCELSRLTGTGCWKSGPSCVLWSGYLSVVLVCEKVNRGKKFETGSFCLSYTQQQTDYQVRSLCLLSLNKMGSTCAAYSGVDDGDGGRYICSRSDGYRR